MPTIDPERARAKAAELQELHDQYHSWRQVKDLHYPKVPAGTLCRIAKSGGTYLPRMHWRNLGLVQRRKMTETQKRISKMARATKKAVLVKKARKT